MGGISEAVTQGMHSTWALKNETKNTSKQVKNVYSKRLTCRDGVLSSSPAAVVPTISGALLGSFLQEAALPV